MLNGLDLFSGIGGLTIALREWVRPVAFCESNRYAQSVLLSRMRSGGISKAPIWDDVRTLSGSMLPDVDIIYGGFPCQDISSAGLGKGLAGERSGLFSEVVRLANELKPAFIFLENVPAIRTRGLSRVGEELAGAGYDCRWDIVSAEEIGAPHKRERWFLLAYPNHLNRFQFKSLPSTDEKKDRPEVTRQNETDKPSDAAWRETQPSISRVADGIPFQLDRHRSLGNAVVPLQAHEAFKRLMGLE
jgi:DNA (cytosine-5)-methyltransferase 1